MKLNRFLSSFTLVLSFFYVQALAQDPLCGFEQAQDRVRRAFPDYDSQNSAMDLALRDQILRSRANATRTGDTLIYTLPVVFHVLYLDPSENLPTSRLLAELTNINEAFRNVGYYDPSVGADARIQFCLTQVAPDGSPHSGIERFQTPLTDIGPNDDFAMKQQYNWDPSRFVNIYVARNLLGGGVAGYAYYPLYHGAFFDGLVLLTTVVGYNKQKSVTAVHEIGHYLGLPHPFDQGCENFDCLLQGDRVCDTPPDNSDVFFEGCVPNNNCQTDTDDPSPLNPFTTDVNDRNDLYMDYNQNSCGRAFTEGQAERMRTVIPNLRQSLLHSFVCQTPEFYDAGVVELSRPGVTACLAGDSMRLIIRNFGLVPLTFAELVVEVDGVLVDTFNWTGTLPYQGQQEIAFQLSSSLSFQSHRLRAWTLNPSGSTDTFSLNDTSELVFNLLSPKRSPFQEGFEAGLPSDWTVVNPLGLGWELKPRACTDNGTNTQSLYLGNQSFVQYGLQDEVVSPLIDLVNQDSIVLTFDYAYGYDVRLNGDEPEDFRVEVSTDCGESYNDVLFSGSGELLATRLIQGENQEIWEPQDCSDWQTVTLPMDQYAGNKILVRFLSNKYENGFGIYLDNIHVQSKGPAIGLEPLVSWVTIAPNPARSEIRGTVSAGAVAVSVWSLEGKKMGNWKFDAAGPFSIDARNLPAGVYALHFQSGNKLEVKRVILY